MKRKRKPKQPELDLLLLPITWTRHRYYLESSRGHLIAAYYTDDRVTLGLTLNGVRLGMERDLPRGVPAGQVEALARLKALCGP